MCKCAVGALLVALRTADSEVCGRANANHQAEAVEQVERWNGNVERGKTGCARATGNKKRVGKDIARNTDHTKYIQRRIAAKGA